MSVTARPERQFGWWDMLVPPRHMGHADFLRERIDGRVGQ
jgi:hypothetical protein